MFRFDSRNVRTQSQNATYQSESLYSSVRSCSPVHVCPSGLSQPSVMDHVGKRSRSMSEPSTAGAADIQNVEVGEQKFCDSVKATAETQDSAIPSRCDEGQTSSTESSRDSTNKTQITYVGIPETGSEIRQPAECLNKSAETSLDIEGTSETKTDLHDIPFMDSTSLLSPERSSNQTQGMHNTQTVQGTKLGATFEAGDVNAQGKHNTETMETDAEDIKHEEVVEGGLLETDLDAIIDKEIEYARIAASQVVIGDNQTASKAAIGGNNLSDIGAKTDKVCDDLIDFGDGDDEYDTADEENVTVGAVGGTH